MEQAPVMTPEAARPTEAVSPAVGRTVIELLARPVEAFGEMVEMRNPTSQPSTQRTWDPVANRPDTQHMVDWD